MQRLVLECAIRAALIAAGTAAVLRVLRVKTAAARHAAWTGVLAMMLMLPVWTAWGPKASLRLLPAPGGDAVESRAAAASEAGMDSTSRLSTPAASPPAWNWQDVMLGVYLLGAGTLLLRLGIGTVRANLLVRRAESGGGRLTSVACAAPVTVGWLHPEVILPEGWREWPPAQVDAVLAHEREHARRRDPLVQWLALLNRAVFWFHPLAWWLERRLAALAEEACDTAVLERGHNPREYAGYLLDLARAVARKGARVDVQGMAMPGPALGQRLRQILEGAPAPRISRTRLASAAAACTIASAVFAAGAVDRRAPVPALLAQVQTTPATPPPAFEVASVKPNKSGDSAPGIGRGGAMRFEGGRLAMENVSLWKCIGIAYGIGEDKDYAISGPDWLKSERYDIIAKLPAGAAPDQARLMLQGLLAERFKLAVHRESKVLAAYALTAGKGGAKLQEAEPGNGRMSIGRGRLTAQKQGMPHFADILSQLVDRPVVDKTELKKVYDFNLEWTPDQTQPPDLGEGGERRAVDSPPGPSIYTALQEQLGLKLEPQKLPVQVLIIDHAEKVPTEN